MSVLDRIVDWISVNGYHGLYVAMVKASELGYVPFADF